MSNPTKKGLFVGDDGKNLMFTFILVSSLFLLWGFCNGMIDVMDKHFQEELGLTKSQSAWVQFAHYLGYFLMSMPAGWLASKLGYKGGIITGLLIVAAGGFWFIPATHINAMVHEGTVSSTTAFVAFLAGVCLIATGLTFLETIANPYTTVLGDPALRGHAHQSGAILQRRRLDFRPDRGQHVFLFEERGGEEHGQPDALHSLRGSGRGGDRDRGDFLLCQRAGHQEPRTTTTWKTPRRGFRIPSGRTRIL